MPQKRLIIAVATIAAIAACQHASMTPGTRAPTAPQPATSGAAPGGATTSVAAAPRPRPPRLSADSLGKLRRTMVNQVLATIAGHENEPAGRVFKNVVYNKQMPAAQFVNMMDSS